MKKKGIIISIIIIIGIYLCISFNENKCIVEANGISGYNTFIEIDNKNIFYYCKYDEKVYENNDNVEIKATHKYIPNITTSYEYKIELLDEPLNKIYDPYEFLIQLNRNPFEVIKSYLRMDEYGTASILFVSKNNEDYEINIYQDIVYSNKLNKYVTYIDNDVPEISFEIKDIHNNDIDELIQNYLEAGYYEISLYE